MARRTPPTASVVFDLEPEPDDDRSATGDLLPDEPRTTVWTTVRSWPRRRVVAGATAVAVVIAASVGTHLAVDAFRDHRTAARLAAAPGGVVDLSHAPTERWRATMPTPQPLAVVDGLLVVQESAGGARAGAGVTLHGISLKNGRIRWTAALPDVSSCGNALSSSGLGNADVGPATSIVCLGGSQQERVVTVGPDGEIQSERTLDAIPDVWFTQALDDGTVLRVAHTGPPATVPKVAADQATGAWTLKSRLATRGVSIRLDDATTGAMRWERKVDGDSADAGAVLNGYGMCAMNFDGSDLDAATEVTLDVDGGWSFDVDQRWVSLTTCGVDVQVDRDTGELVHHSDTLSGDWTPRMSALADGGYMVPLPADDPQSGGYNDRSRIVRADGSVAGEVPGPVLNPMATDGTPSDVLIVQTPTGQAAYAPGESKPRWNVPALGGGGPVLAQAAGVVVANDSSQVVALDVVTGKTLWSSRLEDANGFVMNAYTDGRRVVVITAVPDADGTIDGDSLTRWTALDLSTGHRDWSAPAKGNFPFLVGGHLVRFEHDAVVALG
jgi:outer membrane protein assembly factor BamB